MALENTCLGLAFILGVGLMYACYEVGFAQTFDGSINRWSFLFFIGLVLALSPLGVYVY